MPQRKAQGSAAVPKNSSVNLYSQKLNYTPSRKGNVATSGTNRANSCPIWEYFGNVPRFLEVILNSLPIIASSPRPRLNIAEPY